MSRKVSLRNWLDGSICSDDVQPCSINLLRTIRGLTRPLTREIIFDKSPDKIYEYACHEGNYGMTNILSGHRVLERQAAE
jgi:hypothetical protein